MKILVTGGAGFIGSNYVAELLSDSEQWQEIVVLDALTYAGNLANLSKSLENPIVKFVKGDIRDVELVNTLISKIDVVVHFAAESHVDRSILNPNEFVSTNVLGTNTLLNAALNSKVSKFIHVSTDEVYGSIDSGSWTENSPIAPNSPYSASKASSDLIALAYFKTFGLPVIVTRCSNNYGNFQFPEKLIPLAISNLIDGKKIPIYGDGKNSRDWLDVRDHCRALNLILEYGNVGNVYNIGGGKELSNLELANLLLTEFGLDESYIDFVEDRKGHDRRYSVSFEKAQTECRYEPKFQFENSLKETIDWYRSNENWWRPLKSRIN
jgi:dTDP-glucose 4,6-dehydratase